jgi:hypothetical protein
LEELDLQSILNIEADTLATTELQEYGSIKYNVSFDPLCEVQLNIEGRTITRQLGSAIHNQQHLAALQKYYGDRFRWNQGTFGTIDWSHFAMVYKRFPCQHTFFSKFGWKKLPVAARLYKRTPSYNHRCPTCSNDHEDDDHLFQCDHPTRRQWRTNLLQSIHDMFGEILNPDLMAIIRLGLRSYFASIPPDFSERFPTGYSTTPYSDLIDQQIAIGWDHFWKLSTEWENLQQQYARRYGLMKQSEGWVIRIIRLMAQSCHTLWESRNSCRHGNDSATRAQIQSEQAHREIRCLYLLQDKVLPSDRSLYQNTVDKHLTQSTAQLRAWIQHNKKLICHSVRVATAQLKLNTHRIQSFFPAGPTSRSLISKRQGTGVSVPRRQRPSRISQFFSSRGFSTSRHWSRVVPVPMIFCLTTVSKYFNVIGISQSC